MPRFHVTPLADLGTPPSENSHKGFPSSPEQAPLQPVEPIILEPLGLEVVPRQRHPIPMASTGTPRASARRTTSPTGNPTQPLPPCPQPLAPSLLTVPEQDVIDTAAGSVEGPRARALTASLGLGERLERPHGHRRKVTPPEDTYEPYGEQRLEYMIPAVMERLEASARSVEKKIDQIWGVLSPDTLERLIAAALQRVLKGHLRSPQAADTLDGRPPPGAGGAAIGLHCVNLLSEDCRRFDWACCKGKHPSESEDVEEAADQPGPLLPLPETRRPSVREVFPAWNHWRTSSPTRGLGLHAASAAHRHPSPTATGGGGSDHDARKRSRTPRTPQGEEGWVGSNASVTSEERLVLDQWGPMCSPAVSEMSRQITQQQTERFRGFGRQTTGRSDVRDAPMMTRIGPQEPPNRRRSLLGDRQASKYSESTQELSNATVISNARPTQFKWNSKGRGTMTRTRSQVKRNATRMRSKPGRLVLFICTALVLINAAWVGIRSHYVMRMELMRHGVESHWGWNGVPRSLDYPSAGNSTAEKDQDLETLRRTQGWGHPVLDGMFTLLFLAEVVVRIFLARGDFIWGEQRKWNCFDVVLVCVTIVHWFINVLLIDAFKLNVVRLPRVTFLRILRLPRVAIDLKHVDYIHSLQLMTASIVQSLSFSWVAFSVIMGLIYLFSVCFVQGFVDALEEAEVGSIGKDDLADIATKFGSVQITLLSLFQAISGGVDWKELLQPLSLAPWRYTFLLFVYVFVLIFGVLNIVTSMFVECVYHVTKEDYKERIRTELHAQRRWEEELRRIFVEADEDESGSLSWKEFSSVVGVDDFKAHFATLKLNIEEAKEIFDYLDVEGNGEVHMQDFVRGCVCLRGEARSVDLAVLKSQWDRTSRQLTDDVKRLSRIVEASTTGTEATLISRPRPTFNDFSTGSI